MATGEVDAELAPPRPTHILVRCTALAAVLGLVSAVLYGFGHPLGVFYELGGTGVLTRVRTVAAAASGFYVLLAALALGVFPPARPRRLLRMISAIAATEAALLAYIFVYDIANRIGEEPHRLSSASEATLNLANLVLAAGVTAWTWQSANESASTEVPHE